MLTIARVDLVRLSRDVVALFFIVVLPVVIILIIGSTFGAQGTHTPVGLLDLDHSTSSAELMTAMRRSGVVDARTYTSRSELAQDVRIQNVAAGVVVPAGYGRALEGGSTATVQLLADQKSNASVTLMGVVGDVLDHQGQVLAAVRFAEPYADGGAGVDRAALVERATALQAQLHPVGVDAETQGRASLSSTNRYAYTAPSNLVLFVFINSITGAAAFVQSRQLGVTRRTLAAPLTVGTIMLGAGVTRLLVALLQSGLILAVGALVFNVRWGDPLAVGALVLVFALLATGAGLLIGAIATKPEQVPALGIPISIGLAMLGGCMWPLEVVSPALRTVGHLTPHAWAMDAWISLGFEGGGLGAIAGDLAVLGAVAVGLLALATWRLRRVLR